MEPDRYRDFDLAWQEKAEAEGSPQPLVFVARGQEWRLPASIPAAIIINILRAQKRHGDSGEVPETELIDLALSLFGQEQLDGLMATGLSVDELGDIIKWALEQYGVAQRPNRAARRKAGSKKDSSTSSETGA